MLLTKQQRAAMKRVWLRAASGDKDKGISYRAFRRRAVCSFGCVMVPFAGMWLGIEPDGYTHS